MATRRGPDNSVRFVISGTMQTVNWANVFWATLTMGGTPTQANLDTWLTNAAAAYKTNFASHISTNVAFTQAQAQLFLPNNGLLPSLVAMTGNGTGGTTAPASQATCEVIS